MTLFLYTFAVRHIQISVEVSFMKQLRSRLITIITTMALLCALIPGILISAEAGSMGITTAGDVKFRKTPSTDAEYWFYLPINFQAEVKEVRSAEGITWYKLAIKKPDNPNSNTYTGWVHGDFFRYIDSETPASTQETTPAATAGSSATVTPEPIIITSGTGIGVVTNSGTNVRSGPSTKDSSLFKLNRGAEVTLLTFPEVVDENHWYKISCKDEKGKTQTGYIMSTFIRVISGDQPVTPTSYTHVKLILSSCHLRETPDGKYNPDNDWEEQGALLPLTGKTVSKGGYIWYPVYKGGRTWYVRSDCVQPIGSTTPTPTNTGSPATPTPTPTGSPTATPAPSEPSSYVKTILDKVFLRKSTSTDSTFKYRVAIGTVMHFSERKSVSGKTWFHISYNNDSLWVLGTCVEIMTKAEYEAYAKEHPVITTSPVSAVAWVKTTAGSVNLRKTPAGTYKGQVKAKGTILAVVGTPVTKNGVTWYPVASSVGTMYIHGGYVTVVNSDGSPTPTPTPSSTQTPSESQQEASYTTLKLGSSGTAVKNLVQELINQGFYNGTVVSKYTSTVEKAVRDFQTAKKLTVDGIAGSATQHTLFGTVPIGTGNTGDRSMVLYPAEMVPWDEVNSLWKRGDNLKVYDVKTGKVWWAHRWAGGPHADVEPLTARDTAILCEIYGVSTASKISYERRPCLITIGTRTIACSLYGEEHNYPDGDTIPDNNYNGQACIHFKGSTTSDTKVVDSNHQKAIQYAWENCPVGHK